ncbi:MAG: hypothetical protein Q9159_001099 [Coniocarpon cinnabarinum]
MEQMLRLAAIGTLQAERAMINYAAQLRERLFPDLRTMEEHHKARPPGEAEQAQLAGPKKTWETRIALLFRARELKWTRWVENELQLKPLLSTLESEVGQDCPSEQRGNLYKDSLVNRANSGRNWKPLADISGIQGEVAGAE